MRRNAGVHGQRTTDYRGRVKPARVTGSDCECGNKCFEKVDPGLAHHILTQFNLMPDRNTQNFYLRGLIVADKVQRRGPQGNKGISRPWKEQTRKSSFKYFVQTEDLKRVKVYIF